MKIRDIKIPGKEMVKAEKLDLIAIVKGTIYSVGTR